MVDTRQANFEREALPHLEALHRTAVRTLCDSARASDVVQETFLQAWKVFDRYEPGTNCKAWLHRILFNVLRHERRSWFKWLTGRQDDVAAAATLPAPREITAELTDRDILAALDRLPPAFRAVLMLVDVEEFSYKESSVILSIPIGTVMSRLSRGRAELRLQLASHAAGYGVKGGRWKEA